MASEKDNRETSLPAAELGLDKAPAGVDRRAFMMRSAMIGAVSVLSGCSPSTPDETAAKAATATSPAAPAQPAGPPLSADLDVVKKSKGR